MTLPIPLTTALVALREILRALVFPLHCLWYLPMRRRWQERSRKALLLDSQSTSDQAARLLADFEASARRDHVHVFLSAGEASGEAHARRLLDATEAAAAAHGGRVRWSCFGGANLAGAGADLLVPLADHAVMGVRGVMASVPFLMRTYARFLRLLREDPPDLVVLVDYPGLHVVMAEAARRHGVRTLHYVAPQYWAWAPWRMRRYRRAVDIALTILPFEPAFFATAGVVSAYVGHPLLDRSPPDAAAVAELRAERWLCLLPGSRRAEIELHLPGMVGVAVSMARRFDDLRVMVVHRDPARAPLIRGILERCDPAKVVTFEVGDLPARLAAAQLVIVKSGTGSLEAALFATPNVVVYRVPNAFMMWLARHFLSVPWFAAANLIAGRPVVPERVLGNDDEWAWVEEQASALWPLGPTRLQCLDRLADVQRLLGEPGASDRAARWVLAMAGVGGHREPSA